MPSKVDAWDQAFTKVMLIEIADREDIYISRGWRKEKIIKTLISARVPISRYTGMPRVSSPKTTKTPRARKSTTGRRPDVIETDLCAREIVKHKEIIDNLSQSVSAADMEIRRLNEEISRLSQGGVPRGGVPRGGADAEEINEYRRAVETLMQERDNSQRLIRALEKQVANLRTERYDTMGEAEQVCRVSIEKYQREVSELEAERTGFVKQIQQLERQLSQRGGQSDQMVSRLEAEIEKYRQQLAAVDAQKQDAIGEIQNLQAQLNQARTETRANAFDADELNTERIRALRQIEDLEAKLRQCGTGSNERVSQLEFILTERNEQIRGLEEENQRLRVMVERQPTGGAQTMDNQSSEQLRRCNQFRKEAKYAAELVRPFVEEQRELIVPKLRELAKENPFVWKQIKKRSKNGDVLQRLVDEDAEALFLVLEQLLQDVENSQICDYTKSVLQSIKKDKKVSLQKVQEARRTCPSTYVNY